MNTFQSKFKANASIEKIREFHKSSEALKKLTPPPIFVQIHHLEPLANGSLSKFTLWFGPIALHWLAKHENVTPTGFIDTQIEGPMKVWRHQHQFESIDAEHSLVIDSIEYQFPDGLRGWLLRLLFNPVGLKLMFFYRGLITRWSLRKK
jgi:ligand-binding SRPBCC domain-containing protein